MYGRDRCNVALYLELSELLESHTCRPHSNFPEPMARRGLSRRPGFFWRSRQRGVVAGEFPLVLACLAHEQEAEGKGAQRAVAV